MIYFAVGLFAVFCIGIIIYVIKVYREDRKDRPKNGYQIDEDDEIIRR